MKRYVVVFSGFNIRAVIAFIRTLEDNSVSYGVIAKSNDDDIFKTKYKSKVVYIRKQIALNLSDLLYSIKLIKEAIDYDKCMIAPSTEALNRFILDNERHFEALGCIFPVVNKDLYKLVSDKYSFGNLCKNHNIKVPGEFETIESATFPFVAKPKKYFSSSKKALTPLIITSIDELNNFELKYNKDDFFFQAYIEGRCIYLLYYFGKGNKVDKLSQENFIQQENGGSMIYAKLSYFHNEDISKAYEKLFFNIGFRGLVMIELKIENNECIMIEANPRFWGPSQLFVDANYNFFEFMLMDYDFIELDAVKNTPLPDATYFWNDGIVGNIDARNDVFFYNYSRFVFHKEMGRLIDNEIFNRKDTKILYKECAK